jgi:hypothetical protein
MIFITAKFRIKAENADDWPAISREFTLATATLPAYLAETPCIINVTVPKADWSELGEMAVRE